MAYRLSRDIPLPEALRRTAWDEVDASLSALRQLPTDEAVHEVRKHCKKMRALLRLVRSQIPGFYRYENAHYRALANSLSGSRDAVSIRDALLALAPPERFPNIRAFLELRASEQIDPDAIANASELLSQGIARIDSWPLAELRWRHTKMGYRQSYRRARGALASVREQESLEHYHELRKRVKDHWYHCRLLPEAWREAGPRSDPLKQMAQALGDWRDQNLLCSLLGQRAESFGGELIPLLDTAQGRIAELHEEIQQHGRALFAERNAPCRKKNANN